MRVSTLSIIMFILAISSFGNGLFKLLFYSNPEDSYDGIAINAPIVGDGWNMVINNAAATAWFVLFGALLSGGLLIEILRTLRVNTKKIELEVNPISVYPEDEVETKPTTGDLQ